MKRRLQIETLDKRQLLTSLIGDSSLDSTDPVVDNIVAKCDEAGGGLSTNPDGSTECTIYEDRSAPERDPAGDVKIAARTDRSTDDDEPGLPGVTIYLDLNYNGE